MIRALRRMDIQNNKRIVALLALGAVGVMLTGCVRNTQNSTRVDLAEFTEAGPIRPEVDLRRLVEAKLPSGPYQLQAGDVLDIQLPAMVQSSPTNQPDQLIRLESRISDSGEIALPTVGRVRVLGQSVSEVEQTIAGTYYPEYVVHKPMVVVQLKQARHARVSVVGAVWKPGVYELRADQLTLVNALMKAGGIHQDGAANIHIIRAEKAGEPEEMTLPVKGLDLPFTDVKLQDGDSIEVERREPEMITVVGLVRNSGAYPYPPNAKYTMIQAIAMAGGTDELADPQWAKVYRQDAEGHLVHVKYRITDLGPSGAGNVLLKPGDIVSVEHTARTQARVLLSQIVRAGVGVNAGYRVGPGQ